MTTQNGSIVKYVLISTVAVLILAIYPQVNIWSVQGSDWHGAYVVTNYDETAYSAYVNSLIEGRSRRNDPFMGWDDVPYESLYSIQAVPAYSIALPARALGLSASTAFIVLNFLIPIFASLAIFALLFAVTRDPMLSAVGVLTVLCLGTAIAFQGELRHMITGKALCDFFPFLRRYQPGFAFPLFFVFCLSIWLSFSARENRRALIYAVAGGAVFAILVFSYFFLWTAALAWLVLLALLWFAARKEDRTGVILRTGIVALFAIAAIIPYFMMLSNRSENTDQTQLLTYTRMPNLFEISEIVGLLVLVCIVYLVRRGKIEFRSPEVLVSLSMALTPLVLFNQQIITGRSLQPVHYEIFIANYLILTTVVFCIFLIRQAWPGPNTDRAFRRALLYLGIAAVLWGVIETTASARRNAGFEKLRDDAMPALALLARLTPFELSHPHFRTPAVMSSDLMIAEWVPTVTQYKPLWNPHTNSAGGVNHAENLDLFYKYLYYSGYDEKDLADAINGNLFEVMAALFGGGRALPTLAGEAKPVSRSEVEAEVAKYRDFRARFDSTQALEPLLRYVIVPAKGEIDLRNLDRWYQRDQGTLKGPYMVYNVTLKP
jgi:hypothetical protein